MDAIELSEEGVVKRIIEKMKKGERIPYKWIYEFLMLEDNNTRHTGPLNPEGALGTQLRGVIAPLIISQDLYEETITRHEQLHFKLLRLLAHISSHPIHNLTDHAEREEFFENMLVNYTTIIWGFDDIPMDEHGDLIPKYQNSLPQYSASIKENEGITSPEALQNKILDTCNPERITEKFMKERGINI